MLYITTILFNTADYIDFHVTKRLDVGNNISVYND